MPPVRVIMQLHLSMLGTKVGELYSEIQDTHTFVREFISAFKNSDIVDLEIREYYTYPESQVNRLNKLSQEDEKLIEHIRKNLLIPPKVNGSLPIKDTSKGQSAKILEHFKNKTGGYFIECGAMDGYMLSNTRLLETQNNWTGLLIEADPKNFAALKKSDRNCTLLPTCLSLKKHPMMVNFSSHTAWSKITSEEPGFKVHCMPLFSILKALNRPTIDFFSLDIEGNELDVLRTLPFDEVDIKTFAIEHSNIKEGREHLLEFMLKQGYYQLPSTEKERGYNKWAQEDYIFIKK
ncbi:protein Star-like isoform X2 [Neocloeon triangulifer]|uniref:protein Star-like isoform X2 n=1 Tax=Neocloeon triangulifer TaxID=2078957 RepID=UPI00286F7261|nr:protein Star-like isoform X2 [Neocloeon triangulifer]